MELNENDVRIIKEEMSDHLRDSELWAVRLNGKLWWGKKNFCWATYQSAVKAVKNNLKLTLNRELSDDSSKIIREMINDGQIEIIKVYPVNHLCD